MKYFFVTLAVVLNCSIVFSQGSSSKGTEFWVAFMENVDLTANGQPRFSFLVTSEVNTSGSITLPSTGYVQNFSVTANQVNEVFLPNGVFHPVGSEYIDSMGIKITTSDPVTVIAHHHRLYFGEASVVLPVTELDDEYMIMAHDDFYDASPSEFVVLATEDNTVIDITPSALTKGFRPAGVTFNVTLDAGDVYQVQSNDDLAGSMVKARDGKKIAVFSGARQAMISCIYADDHLYEQDYPLRSWGGSYAAIPFSGQGGDIFRVLASYDQTEVYFNCTKVRTLNKGQYFDTLRSLPVMINSSFPVAVAQFTRSNDCTPGPNGDPNMLMLQPVTHFSKKTVFNALAHSISSNPYVNHYVNIISPTSGVQQVKLDNTPIGSAFFTIAGNPGYSYSQIPLTQGTHTLESDSGFIAYSYGYGNYVGYACQLGFDGVRNYNDQLDIQYDSTICAGEAINFMAVSSGQMSSWSWSFGDGSTSNAQNAIHTYSVSGTYPVTLSAVDSSGCLRFSEEEVIIEECPEQAEEDGEACVFVPSAFSPNNDSHNDLLCVYGKCIASMTFSVFDRWGEKVFATNDIARCWDGSYKGELMNTGVFFYYLEADLTSGQRVIKKGDISLIR